MSWPKGKSRSEDEKKRIAEGMKRRRREDPELWTIDWIRTNEART